MPRNSSYIDTDQRAQFLALINRMNRATLQEVAPLLLRRLEVRDEQGNSKTIKAISQELRDL